MDEEDLNNNGDTGRQVAGKTLLLIGKLRWINEIFFQGFFSFQFLSGQMETCL